MLIVVQAAKRRRAGAGGEVRGGLPAPGPAGSGRPVRVAVVGLAQEFQRVWTALGGHLPVPAQQHRGRVHPQPVGDRARVQPGRGRPRWSRSRSTGRPAPAAATPSRTCRSSSQVCAHDAPALSAPSRAVPYREHCADGSRVLALVRVRIPGQPRPGMTGRPATPAVLAALPLRGLPRLPLRHAPFPWPRSAPSNSASRNWSCPSPAGAPARRPAALAVGATPAPPPAPRTARVLRVPGLHHCPQPGQQLTLLPSTSRQG